MLAARSIVQTGLRITGVQASSYRSDKFTGEFMPIPSIDNNSKTKFILFFYAS